jgi:hypothetical protein
VVEAAERTLPEGERVLVVPLLGALPVVDGSPVQEGTVQLMLRQVLDGAGEPHLALLAFGTVTGLVEAMGEDQPWAAIPAAELEAALAGSGAEAVLIDPVVTSG